MNILMQVHTFYSVQFPKLTIAHGTDLKVQSFNLIAHVVSYLYFIDCFNPYTVKHVHSEI